MLWKELEDVWMSVLLNLTWILCPLQQYIYVTSELEYKFLGHIATETFNDSQAEGSAGSGKLQSTKLCVLTSHGPHTVLNMPPEAPALQGVAVSSP